MSSEVLGRKFNVIVTFGDGTDSKPTRKVDMHQAVKKPLFFTRFNQSLPDDAIQLGYVSVGVLEADQNIAIIDRSTAAPENYLATAIDEETFSDINFLSFYRDILITDVYTDEIPTQPIRPLFYKHTLPANTDINSVYILDGQLNRLSPYSYKVEQVMVYDETTGQATSVVDYVVVYNDFHNFYNEDTGVLKHYYVQYVDSTTSTPEAKVVLLNNENIYREATFQDIWSQTLRLKPWVKAYLVNVSTIYYQFTMPQRDVSYRVRYQEKTRLNVAGPVIDDKEYPWFLRITNGAFNHTHNNEVYRYQVAEFSTQQFNPLQPYKFVVNELGELVAPGIVYFEHKPLAFADLSAQVIIKSKNDSSVLYALTTNTTKHGNSYFENGIDTGVKWDSTKILSYDAISGLVHIDLSLKDYYRIYGSFYYKEEYYELSMLNLNPLFNQDAMSSFYVVYLVPAAAANGNQSQEASIHYLRVTKDGTIRECSQNGSDGNTNLDQAFPTGVIGMSYGRPGIDADTFLNEYSLEASLGENGQDKRYLILAEVSVIRQSSIEDITYLDTRIRGGGIKDDYEQAAKEKNPEVAWYGDIGLGGGVPYPGRSVVIARLPHCLLSTYGGRFTENQIREIVKRHMAFGHYPVIKFYGIKPRISITDFPEVDSVKVSWPSEISTCTFNVYYSVVGDRYTKHNDTALTDSGIGNEYTIDGLTSGLKYNIYIESMCSVECGQGGGSPGDGDYGPDGPNSSDVITVEIIRPTNSWNTLGHEFEVTIS